jgi:hypothetical protein
MLTAKYENHTSVSVSVIDNAQEANLDTTDQVLSKKQK